MGASAPPCCRCSVLVLRDGEPEPTHCAECGRPYKSPFKIYLNFDPEDAIMQPENG